MDNRFKFEEEFDEVAIAIDYSDVLGKESILYSVTKRLIDIVGSLCGIINVILKWQRLQRKGLKMLELI